MSTSTYSSPGWFSQQTLLIAAQGDPMLRIEIWKSKAAWQALSLHERTALLGEIGQLIQDQLPPASRVDGGPFLVKQSDAFMLIWTAILPETAKTSAVAENPLLAKYFEPLVYLRSEEGLTAGKLADQMFRGTADV